MALQALLHFLFPAYPPTRGAAEGQCVLRPQGIFVDEPTDYWRRYLSPTAVRRGESDQAALASIHSWRDGKPNDLLGRLLGDARGRQISQFAPQFHGDALCRLLSELANAARGDACNGMEEPSRRAWVLSHPWHDDRLQAVAGRGFPHGRPNRQGLRAAAPANRAHGDCVFARRGKNSYLVPETACDELQKQVWGVLESSYCGDGGAAQLATTLRDATPFLLRWLLFAQDGDLTLLPPAGLPNFSAALVKLRGAARCWWPSSCRPNHEVA